MNSIDFSILASMDDQKWEWKVCLCFRNENNNAFLAYRQVLFLIIAQ